MNLSAPIYQLKRKAKLLSRETSVPLNKALDHVARDEGYQSWSLLMDQNQSRSRPKTWDLQTPTDNRVLIRQLPLEPEDRSEFVKLANSTFELVIERMEPDNPNITRELWDAEDYVDHFLSDHMLPIDRDYALSLIEAFLMHHVSDLAVRADQMSAEQD